MMVRVGFFSLELVKQLPSVTKRFLTSSLGKSCSGRRSSDFYPCELCLPHGWQILQGLHRSRETLLHSNSSKSPSGLGSCHSIEQHRSSQIGNARLELGCHIRPPYADPR